MRATIDKAGRLVIPKQLRDHLGLLPGEVEVTADGAGLRVEPLAGDSLDERDGRLVIPAGGVQIDDALVGAAANEHRLRLATRDRRAMEIYRALDVDAELLP